MTTEEKLKSMLQDKDYVSKIRLYCCCNSAQIENSNGKIIEIIPQNE